MKYFIIRNTIRDGEYEYMDQGAYKAKNEADAIKQCQDEASEWIAGDYRISEINACIEISEHEYKIISKYIY